jgi:hypothetical protein
MSRFSKISDFHGIGFTFTCNGRTQEGKISCYRDELFMCQDEINGATCPENFGYRYTYSLGRIRVADVFSDNYMRANYGFYDFKLRFNSEIPYDQIKSKLIISKKIYLMLSNTIYVRVKDSTSNAYFDFGNIITSDGEKFVLDIVKEDREPNCFDIKDGVLTYTNGIQPLINGEWSDKSRQVMKISKFINSLRDNINFVENISDTEKMRNRSVELYTLLLEQDLPKVLISDNISSVYKMQTSKCFPTGTLGSSCMNNESGYKGKEHIEEVYNNIPGLKIAYTLDIYGDLLSRALLWHDVVDDDASDNITKFNFMDRIYGSEKNIESMKRWAKENGYLYKLEQSYRNSTLVKDEMSVFTKYSIDVPFEMLKGSPYVDTMCIFDIDNKKLRSSRLLDMKRSINLQVVDGNIRVVVRCPHCGSDVLEQNLQTSSDGVHGCSDCLYYLEYSESYQITAGWYGNVEIVRIQGNRVRVPKNWSSEYYIFCKDVNSYIHRSDVRKCAVCGEFFYYRNVKKKGDVYVCSDHIKEYSDSVIL